MCNSYHIESFVEPLLRSLDINESVRDSEYGKRRADVVVPSFDDVMNVVDVVTVDVCKKNALKNAQSEVSPLDDSELYKRKKYANPLKELKHVRHVDYQICPFAISLYGRLGKTALNFIDDFENLVKKRMNKRFDRRLWLNRIVFTIFKSIPKTKREFELKSAQQILKCSVPAVAVVKGAENNVSDDQQLNASSVPSSSPSENSNFCCPFCKKRCCRFTKWSKTSVLPPIRIPVEISPASTIPFSMEMRNFTSELKIISGIFHPSGNILLEKTKIVLRKKFGNRKIVKSKICRKLCLRGRYGAAKQSLFSSSLADANSDTLEKLQKLHPQENFKCSKPEVCPFWIENPITAIEVLKAIQKLPKGKAAGPSGISFDLLKIACSSAPEIADDLAHYFQQLIVLKINPPFELLAARLIALVKPGNGIKPDGIRPIAVGESLSRLLASIVFDRVKDKASTFLNPHQFGIKTIDGASVAAIASDTFFNAEENNFIFNLDFKNAFNSVKREAIFEVIKSDFPELSSFFYHFYGKESDLILIHLVLNHLLE
ncbi:hypothetical protein P9112_007181 [Eukaryota sp. TZLM1-RC]